MRMLILILVTKIWIFTKKIYLKQGIGQETSTKAFLKGRKPGLFLNFGQFPCSRIRIRIPNTDPDPGAAKSMRIRPDLDLQNSDITN